MHNIPKIIIIITLLRLCEFFFSCIRFTFFSVFGYCSRRHSAHVLRIVAKMYVYENEPIIIIWYLASPSLFLFL